MSDISSAYSDPDFVSRYVEGPLKFVPGFADMHAMVGVLIAEQSGDDADLLVVGAGGGLELRALASRHDGWTFTGVDPAAQMLELGTQVVGPLSARITLIEGTVAAAPDGPFDAATCLLTLHFLSEEERLETLQGIRQRLRPGAPLVVVHSSLPGSSEVRQLWMSRYAAFAAAAGAEPETIDQARQGMEALPHLLSPEEDESLLRQAGFADVALFYAAFNWRGWVAYA